MIKSKIKPNAGQFISDYIAKQEPWAQDICNKLRQILNDADKNMLEDWKWGPNFNCNGMVCGFGAFKNHVTLTFFKGADINDVYNIFNYGELNNHNRSIKYTGVKDINSKQLTNYIKQAIALNLLEPKLITDKKKEIEFPEFILNQLKTNPKAEELFNKLSYSSKKEYLIWLTTAKRETTKEVRLSKFIDMLLAGKKEPN